MVVPDLKKNNGASGEKGWSSGDLLNMTVRDSFEDEIKFEARVEWSKGVNSVKLWQKIFR